MKTFSLLIAIFCSYSGLAQSAGKTAEMTIPGVPGVLQIDVGPTTFQTKVLPDGKEVQLRAFDRPDGIGITAFLQRVAFPASAEKCREEWWPGSKKSMPMQLEDLKESPMKDGIARVEYIVPEFQGIKVRQKSVHAYLGARDLCAEVHLSKTAFEPGDQKLFEEVLSAVRLLPDQPSSPRQDQSAPASPFLLTPSNIFAKAANTIYSRTTRQQRPPTKKPSSSRNKSALSPRAISAFLPITWGCLTGSAAISSRRRRPSSMA